MATSTPVSSLKRPLSDVAFNTPAHRWGSSSSPGMLVKPVGAFTAPTVPLPLLTPESNLNSPAQRPDPSLFIGIRPSTSILVGRKCPTPAPSDMHAFVALPPTAKHASRVHARISLSSDLRLSVEVLGQNGVRIGEQRFRAGESHSERMEKGSVATLDFFGCLLLVEVEMPLRSSFSSSPMRLQTSEPEALVSEPPALDEQDMDLASSSEDDGEDDESEEEAEPQPAPSLIIESEPSVLLERAKAAGIDLYGTLASALVFQSRATLSTAELAQLAVETCPALADLKGWERDELLEDAMTKGPFGRIDSAGVKDATGTTLDASWFYRPEADGDRERAASLSLFAKAPRNSQRGRAKQYYYEPIRDAKRRRYE